jgi:hypothetical protein
MNVALLTNTNGPRVMKTVAVIAVLTTAALACSMLYAFNRGPIVCDNNCEVRSPIIDSATQEFLEKNLAIIDGWIPMWMYATGTSYMICNATHCATYVQNLNGHYVTDRRMPIDPPPGGIGSGNGNPGGGSGGGGGGSGGGGGGGGGGSGTVTVGEPDQVRPPNQEN